MLSYFLLFSNFAISAPPPPLWGPAPKDIQYQYHTEEMSAFIHYGMNTYTGIEWGDGSEDPNLFKPTNLDTDQWVSVLKRAGFKRLIMVGRHHDGFCNWKTKFSNHSVNLSVDFQLISQFLHQSGDVLEEVSKSCTKFNVDMGLYLSPWDVNSSYYGDEVLYNEYYMNQLDEILNSNKRYGNNGKIVEVWMDGAKGEGSKAQIYWFSKWFELIRKHQPECVIWSGHGSEVRWIGNEKGIAGEPCWDRFDLDNQIACADKLPTCDPNLQDPNTGLATGQNYSVGECDVSITNGWFWKSGKVPKTMKELASIYFTSVARGQILLLNVPPNTEGKMPEDMSNNALQLGRDIWESFSLDFVRQNGVKFSATNTRESDTNMFSPENVADGTNKTYWTMDDDKTTGSITIDFGRFRTFDIISIREHIHLGQRIARASVDYHTNDGWKTLSTITTIGYHRIIRLDPVSADMIRVNILESQAVPLIQNIEVFLSVGSISQKVVPPDSVTEIPNSQFTKTGTWKDSDDGITNDKSGSSLEAKFTGTRCFVIGTIDPKYGKLNIFIDNQQVATIDCAITSTAVSLASTRITKSVLYQYDGEMIIH
ncbi:Alpha-L-fucosidase 1 [Tritrichomonas foetus]|uniref:alpha-L-fucosidase n=1 Tax=Tritrichomonas foetus TaxID=1144522 RepID=A0A1J4JKZ3_9EUKA|nr:Alpha-L-fucosidase 1 [Tritrichomonas foetus]|eukprot:OHS98243.1 Alpha-L-fucosidase 1 [Tritrichomonas foetus]